ncbi:MAG: hypothetical protein WAW61_07250 [Methylococcaceae bacterium]
MSDKFVIDTNVAIAANGRNTHAGITCQLACINWLENCRNLHIALDKSDLIMTEYERHLSHKGGPGVGDMFFKYLHNNQYASSKIHLVEIHPNNEPDRGFEELPINQLDPSDRKFLSIAVVAKAIIINATDSDWAEQNELLDLMSVMVKQLCPEHTCKAA